MDTSVEDLANKIELKVLEQVSEMLESISRTMKRGESKTLRQIAESVYSNTGNGDSSENFDGWLPINVQPNALMRPTEGELRLIREACRSACVSNPICKSINFHRRNHIVGGKLTFTVLNIEDSQDAEKMATKKADPIIKTMMDNWSKFSRKNKMQKRFREWIARRDRDGEVFLRLIPTKGDAPKARNIDPYYIQESTSDRTSNKNTYLGIKTDGSDEETVVSYPMRTDDLTANGLSMIKPTEIPVEEMIHDKANVDMDIRRGISSYWPVLPELRRLQKIFLNISVIVQIQSAIALIRKHKAASQGQVDKFVRRNSDGQTHTDKSTDMPITAKKLRPGTVLDAPLNVEYEYPAHKVAIDQFVAAAILDLQNVANNFVLPVDWLMSKESTEPLSNGSPVIKNFEAEQADFFDTATDLFWMVQGMMGVKVDTTREKYKVVIKATRLAVAKAIDEARIHEIYMNAGVKSVQTVCQEIGEDYTQERANNIQHRATKQDGEQVPGDSQKVNPEDQASAGGNGMSKKKGGVKKADGEGGDTSK